MLLAALAVLLWLAPSSAPPAGESMVGGPLGLGDHWKFHEGDNPLWADPQLDDSSWAEITVPSDFGRDYAEASVAWYRFTVATQTTGRPSDLALLLGKIDSAYEVYLGGARIGGVGQMPPTPRPDFDRHAIYPIPPAVISEQGDIIVALRVWSSPSTGAAVGGPRSGPFLVGSTRDLIWHELRSELHILFLAGLFCMLGAVYLAVFRPGMKLRLYLWFGLLSWLFALYGVLISQWRYQLSDDFVLLKGIELVTAFLLLPLIVEVSWSASDMPLRWPHRLVQAVSLGFALIAAMTPGLETGLLLVHPFNGLLLATAAVGILSLLRGAYRRRQGSLLLATGGCIAAGFFVYNTLVEDGLIDGPQLPLVGLAIFLLFVGFAVILQMRRRVAIHERAREQQLTVEHNEQFFRAISQQLPEHLYLVDLLDGAIIHANATSASAFGRNPASIQQQRLGDLLDAPSRVLWREHLKHLSQGETIRFEGRFEFGKGRAKPYEIAAKSIHFGDRQAALITARDISSQKAVEDALRQGEQLAEAANRAKSDFLANMSHEIRTPMTAILGVLDLILDEEMPQPLRESIEVVDTSAKHLLNLLNEILDFSKIEAGKMILEEVSFDVLSVIEGSVSLLMARANAKGIELSYVLQPDLPQRIIGDPARLRQVLLNLLSNAIKFTDAGSVILTLATADDEKTLRATVTDTGMGIAPETAQRLFTPFHQADSSTTRRFGGTGLGLAISKQIAILLGGDLTVESQLGEGSSFILEWPLHIADAAPPEERRASAAAAPLKRRTVLVAEDNPINLMVVKALLAKLGLDVVTATTGVDAIARLAQGNIDVVLMDCQMPEMDGYEATRQIRLAELSRARAGRADPNRPAHVPIIALTAHAVDGERMRCLQAGMDDFVSKPYRREELRDVLARWLDDELELADDR